MERDFLGLNSKQSLPLVKEIGFSKSSEFQWQYSNKQSSAVPRLMNFDFGQGDKAKKIGYDSMVSPDFMHIATPDAAQLQKSFIHNSQQVGNHFPFTRSSSVQHDVHRVHRPYDRKMYPQSFLPTLGPFGGRIELRKSVGGISDSGSPAQLTIFYAGTVNVYNDINPEKAHAIMLLAGNGSSTASNVAHPKVQVQIPISKPVQFETGVQSRSGSTSTDELTVCKATGSPTTSTSKVEPPKFTNTFGSVSASGMMPSVPQARKASLARFLEKRKERVMSGAPYDLSKKYLQCTTLESNA